MSIQSSSPLKTTASQSQHSFRKWPTSSPVHSETSCVWNHLTICRYVKPWGDKYMYIVIPQTLTLSYTHIQCTGMSSVCISPPSPSRPPPSVSPFPILLSPSPSPPPPPPPVGTRCSSTPCGETEGKDSTQRQSQEKKIRYMHIITSLLSTSPLHNYIITITLPLHHHILCVLYIVSQQHLRLQLYQEMLMG